MPPKGSIEEVAPATPDSGYASPKGDGAPPKKRSRTKKQPPKEPVFHALETAKGAAGPLSLAASIEGRVSEMNVKSGEFEYTIKFTSQRSFTVGDVFTDNNDGRIHTVMEPAKPFPLMELPDELLSKILKLVVLPEGKLSAKIFVMNTTTGPWSKNFAEGLKDRLGVLRVNKKIHEATLPLLYGEHIKFENTHGLSNFIMRIGNAAKNHLGFVEITAYKKDNGMALSALAQCPKLRRVHIATNVGLASSPSKAAKAFYAENSFFFQSVATPTDPYRGLGLLTFGKTAKCFSIKDGDGEKRAWTDLEKDEFAEKLKSQIK